MNLVVVALVGALTGFAIGTHFRVIVLACSIFCAWAAAALAHAFGQIKPTLPEFLLWAIIIAFAMQIGYFIALLVRVYRSPKDTASKNSKPLIDKR